MSKNLKYIYAIIKTVLASKTIRNKLRADHAKLSVTPTKWTSEITEKQEKKIDIPSKKLRTSELLAQHSSGSLSLVPIVIRNH